VPRQVYDIKAASGGAPSTTDFVFPTVRAPLNAIQKDLIVFDNLDMVSATVDATAASNAPYAGEMHSLAAPNRGNSATEGGPSSDQYIAQAINANGPVTKIPSRSLASQTCCNVSGAKVCVAA